MEVNSSVSIIIGVIVIVMVAATLITLIGVTSELNESISLLREEISKDSFDETDFDVVIIGEGNDIQATTASTKALACDPSGKVKVIGKLAGGAAGNKFNATASCSTAVGHPGDAVINLIDKAGGHLDSNTGGSGVGIGTCTKVYDANNVLPMSKWWTICTFG